MFLFTVFRLSIYQRCGVNLVLVFINLYSKLIFKIKSFPEGKRLGHGMGYYDFIKKHSKCRKHLE